MNLISPLSTRDVLLAYEKWIGSHKGTVMLTSIICVMPALVILAEN